MLSDLGRKIEQLNKILESTEEGSLLDNREMSDDLLKLLREIQELEAPYYEEFDFTLLMKNIQALAKLAGTNMLTLSAGQGRGSTLTLLIKLFPLLANEVCLDLIAYAMKQSIILALAEQQAKKKASEGLARWTVSEPEQGLNPNPDLLVPPPAEPPVTSSPPDPQSS